jgi:hypothetical protein
VSPGYYGLQSGHVKPSQTVGKLARLRYDIYRRISGMTKLRPLWGEDDYE